MYAKLKACFYSTSYKSPRPLLISPNKTLRRCRAYNRQFTALHTFSKYGKWRIIHVVLLLAAVVLAWGQASWGTKSQDAHLASPADFLFLFLYRFWPFSQPCPRPLYVVHSKITHRPTFPTLLLPTCYPCAAETGYQHVLNMAAKSAIERGISTIWQKILTVVNNALVYLDSRTAEWIHWCGSLQDFIDAGALNVCDISSARVSTTAAQ